MKRPLFILFSIAFLAIITASWLWHRFTMEVHHQTMVSSDGQRRVSFFKKRVPPYLEGVDVIAEYQKHGGSVFRQTVSQEDLWEDFDEFSQFEWQDSKSLVLGSPESFKTRRTGRLQIENHTVNDVSFLNLSAGGQRFVILDLTAGESRSLLFTFNIWSEWISAEFIVDGHAVHRGTDFITRESDVKESEFVVRLFTSDIEIDNSDFEKWTPKARLATTEKSDHR